MMDVYRQVEFSSTLIPTRTINEVQTVCEYIGFLTSMLDLDSSYSQIIRMVLYLSFLYATIISRRWMTSIVVAKASVPGAQPHG